MSPNAMGLKNQLPSLYINFMLHLYSLRVKLWKVTSGSSVPGIRHRSVPTIGATSDSPEVGREALELAERNQGKCI